MTRLSDVTGTALNAPPKVSVVIPAYNAAWCVGRAVESVLAQDYCDYELIVVDDGSQDETPKVLAGYGNAIRIVRKANGGLSSARNAGIHAAQGEYVAFLDADDWWLATKLARQVTLMEAKPGVVFCSTAATVQTPDGHTLNEWRCTKAEGCVLEQIFHANATVAGSGSTVMARRKALLATGGFDETLRSLEDIDMWMRLATLGDYACIEDALAVILKHPVSMSKNLDVMRTSAMAVMKKNRQLLPPDKRGTFWRQSYAGMLADYAKWEYRQGRTWMAVLHLLQGLVLAPFGRGRLLVGLLLAVLRRQQV